MNAKINYFCCETHNTMTKEHNHWYTSWFDTPFYHILYKERNDEEAKLFIDNITNYLNIPKKAKVLDLACGKGRHSKYLNSLDYDVTGVDLSSNSIEYANQFANDTLRFKVHNMANPVGESYEAIFNLFTSFGYFDNEEDNLNTIKAIKSGLDDFGFGVIDFMNVDFIIKHLIEHEVKTVDGIEFHIHRFVENGFIKKNIDFNFKNKNYHFQEAVKALSLKQFEDLFNEAGVHLIEILGNYKLQKFDLEKSERLIMIFK